MSSVMKKYNNSYFFHIYLNVVHLINIFGLELFIGLCNFHFFADSLSIREMENFKFYESYITIVNYFVKNISKRILWNIH